jgi:predicted kinase
MKTVPEEKGLIPVSELLDKIVTGTPALVLLAGPPASGKSTVSEGLEKRGFFRLSMDAIRGELFGDEGIYRDQQKVKALMMERFAAALAEKRNIYTDNTNCLRKLRDELTVKAREAGYKHIVLLVMFTPLETCIERNKGRSRVVPEDVIRQLHAALDGKGRPTADEGWVIEVRPGPDRDHVCVEFGQQ